jgi:hypothetical protein
MTKIPSAFVPLDVNYAHDRAIRSAGPMAELLFIRGMAYSRGKRTEGLLPDYDLPVFGVGIPALTKHAKALVREALWVETDGGWLIRSFGKWNPISEQQRHEKQSEGGVRGNHTKWHIGPKGKPSDQCALCVPIGTESVSDRYTDTYPTSVPITEREREVEERDSSSSPYVTRGSRTSSGTASRGSVNG